MATEIPVTFQLLARSGFDPDNSHYRPLNLLIVDQPASFGPSSNVSSCFDAWASAGGAVCSWLHKRARAARAGVDTSGQTPAACSPKTRAVFSMLEWHRELSITTSASVGGGGGGG